MSHAQPLGCEFLLRLRSMTTLISFLLQDLLEPWVSLLGDSREMGATQRRTRTRLKCCIIRGHFSGRESPPLIGGRGWFSLWSGGNRVVLPGARPLCKQVFTESGPSASPSGKLAGDQSQMHLLLLSVSHAEAGHLRDSCTSHSCYFQNFMTQRIPFLFF